MLKSTIKSSNPKIHSFNVSLHILQNASFKEKWLLCSLAVSVENCLQTSWKCSAPAWNQKLSLQIHQKGARSSSRRLNTHQEKLKVSAAVIFSGSVHVRLYESLLFVTSSAWLTLLGGLFLLFLWWWVVRAGPHFDKSWDLRASLWSGWGSWCQCTVQYYSVVGSPQPLVLYRLYTFTNLCKCVCVWTDGHASYCVTVGGTG